MTDYKNILGKVAAILYTPLLILYCVPIVPYCMISSMPLFDGTSDKDGEKDTEFLMKPVEWLFKLWNWK